MERLKEWIEKEVEDIKKKTIEDIEHRVKAAKYTIDDLKKYLEDVANIKIPKNFESLITDNGIIATDKFTVLYDGARINVSIDADRLFITGYASQMLNNITKGKYKITLIIEKIGDLEQDTVYE